MSAYDSVVALDRAERISSSYAPEVAFRPDIDELPTRADIAWLARLDPWTLPGASDERKPVGI